MFDILQIGISSKNLAGLAKVNDAQVRRDLSYLGTLGTRGVGYDVSTLRNQTQLELGLVEGWSAVIIGVGNLGSALAHYGGFKERGFGVVALFDDDPKKSGVKKDEIYSFFEYCLSKGNNPIGIMTIPSIDSQPEIVFSNMQNINEKLKKNYGYQGELSMGMSNDYEIALDYGATIVRIGTKLFK